LPHPVYATLLTQ